MALAADPFQGREPGIQRGRGGFLRNAQGTAYVSDPTGAVVKSGARKGEPKRIPYGSPSGAGKLIENSTALEKWGERRLALGLGLDTALAAECAALVTLDVDSDEYKSCADRIIVAAKTVAQAHLAAERGIHTHAILEDDDEGRDWIERAEAGELLGIPADVQHSLVQAWRDMLARNGLEVLVSEAACVDDTWRLAGTLDNIARLTHDLSFVIDGGEVVTIPAGTVLVLDKKTGQRKTDRNGVITYWHGYSVQIAAYAQSVPYDLDTETRGEWPWPISQDHALIAHLDVLGALDGNPSCELIYVDLRLGREHGGECVQMAKAWAARKDVFSVAQLPADEVAVTGVSTREDEDGPLAGTAPVTALIAGEGDGTHAVTPAGARGVPIPPLAPSIAAEPRTANAGDPADAPREDSPPPAVLDLHDIAAPDEGGPADPAAVDALRKRYMAVDPAIRKGWLADLATQAQTGVNGRGRCPYNLGADAAKYTVRRFEITRATTTLAEAGGDDGARTELLRVLLATIVGDGAMFANVPAGQALGSLDAVEAARFAALVDAWCAEPRLDEFGVPTARHLAA